MLLQLLEYLGLWTTEQVIASNGQLNPVLIANPAITESIMWVFTPHQPAIWTRENGAVQKRFYSCISLSRVPTSMSQLRMEKKF